MREITGFKNGVYAPVNDITIPVDNIGVNRGYGAFDFFGVINNKPFFLNRHLDRFFRSLELLRLKIDFSRQQVEAYIEEVIKQNNTGDFFMKLFAIPLNSDTAPSLNCGFYIVPVSFMPFGKEIYVNGCSLITKEYERFAPEAKSTNYLPLIYWHNEICTAGAIDVLYHSNGTIKETSRGNIFIVKNNIVSTPGSDILRGISRSIVIDIAKSANLRVKEKPVSLDELFTSDEVFLTSTTKKVLPVVKIDGKTIYSGLVGPVTKMLMNEFDKLREQCRNN
ncbi:MAG: aminotransferase class IV [Bacteroidales bacterium]|nr:aminotransferase class IV [Bacteroidales bacterium]